MAKRKVTKAPAENRYWVSTGTRQNMNPARGFPIPSKAKAFAAKFFEDWKPHCLRFDNEAHAKLCQATQSIDELAVDSWGGSPWENSSAAAPMVWSVHVGNGLIIRVEMWRS